MKFWPTFGSKLETRASYTDAVVQAFLHNAEGKSLALPCGNRRRSKPARG